MTYIEEQETSNYCMLNMTSAYVNIAINYRNIIQMLMCFSSWKLSPSYHQSCWMRPSLLGLEFTELFIKVLVLRNELK